LHYLWIVILEYQLYRSGKWRGSRFRGGKLGGIWPLGIDERYRGRKHGLGIVQAAVTFLRERNIEQMAIDMTPYVDFYGKLGFSVYKSCRMYAKEPERNRTIVQQPSSPLRGREGFYLRA